MPHNMLVVVRNNNLFATYLPLLIGWLRTLGHTVQEQVFPEGTDEVVISRWFGTLGLDALKGRFFLSDYTCRDTLQSKFGFDACRPLDLTQYPTLDRLFDDATLRAIGGETEALLRADNSGEGFMSDDTEKDAAVRRAYVRLFRELIAVTSAPEHVIVALNRADDHIGAEERGIPEQEERVGLAIKDCLVQAGVPADIISLVRFEEAPEDDDGFRRRRGGLIIPKGVVADLIKKPSTWLLRDRHLALNMEPDITNFRLCTKYKALPLGNLFGDVSDVGLQPSGLEAALESVVKEKFS